MIEGEWRSVTCGVPISRACIRGSPDAVIPDVDQSEICYGDDSVSGIPVGGAIGVELFEKYAIQPSFFRKFAANCFIERFIHPDVSAWKRPAAHERRKPSANEKNLQRLFIEPENHGIDGDTGSRIFIDEPLFSGGVSVIG